MKITMDLGVKGMYFYDVTGKKYFYENLFNNIDFKLLCCDYVCTEPFWKINHNFCAPFNRMYFVTKGDAVLKNDSDEIHLLPGNIYTIPLNTNYICTCNNKLEKLYIHFNLELLPGIDVFSYIDKPFIALPYHVDLIVGMTKKSKNTSLVNMLSLKSNFLQIISRVLEPYEDFLSLHLQMSYKYSQLFQLIKQNIYKNITVNELADRMGMNVDTMSRNFKKDTGYTLKNFIDSAKFQKIKQMLIISDLSIKEISNMFHFSDEFYFSRFFKKMSGTSPSRYRNEQSKIT